VSPRAPRPSLADQISARRDELRLLALPDINAGPAAAVSGVQEAPVAAIEPNPDQPRREFSPVRLAELAASIRAHGVITPVLISPLPPGPDGPRYQLVAGERRWRAAQMAERETIPALIRDVSPAQALELALIENLHRQDLSPVEEALAYRRLLQEHAYTQQQLGSSLSRSQTYISKRMALLALDPVVVTMLETGELSASAARELARLKDQAQQRQAALAIAEGRLNARQIERKIRELQLAEQRAADGAEPELAAYGQPVDLEPVAQAAGGLLAALEALPVGLDADTQARLREHLQPVAEAVALWLEAGGRPSPPDPLSRRAGEGEPQAGIAPVGEREPQAGIVPAGEGKREVSRLPVRSA
jgi:ParB family chromosome partitioning protein